MEDANGGLSIPKRSITTIGWKSNKPTSIKDKEWEILNRKALGTIWLCLAVSVAFNISKEKTTVDMINALAKLYEKPSASNKVS